jgi:hypothetical protein
MTVSLLQRPASGLPPVAAQSTNSNDEGSDGVKVVAGEAIQMGLIFVQLVESLVAASIQ